VGDPHPLAPLESGGRPGTPERPNILLIMADQLRADWLGPDGPGETPCLDSLSARGATFSRCYTNSPQCAPARISLAAGRYPWRLGAFDNEAVLPLGTPTLYAALRDAGFRVGVVGKLDLKKTDEWNGLRGDRPATYSWGFTHPVEVEGKMHAAHSLKPVGPYSSFLAERGRLADLVADYAARQKVKWVGSQGARDSILAPDEFADTWIGLRARECLEQLGSDYPWFMQVSFVGPHDPYDPPSTFAEGVRSRAMPPPHPAVQGRPRWIERLRHDEDAETVAHARRQYTASLRAIDDQIGNLLAYLERSGQLDRTVVLFTSDHGDLLGDHGLWQKKAPYEASVHIPLILAGPDIPRQSVDHVVGLVDVAATVCALGRADFAAGVDSRSLLPLLEDGVAAEHGTLIANGYFRCWVDSRYKVIRHHSGETEIYDIAKDPGEQHNVVFAEPDLTAELVSAMEARFAASNAS
jgi:arylsulfatase A-like enzyme